MSTNFGYQMPNPDNNASWFYFDAYDAPHKIILPELVKMIYQKGFRKIYLSMGSKYAEHQKKIQTLTDFQDQMKELEGVHFDLVVIDCLNPPDVSITDIFPSDSYLMSEDRGSFNKQLYESWLEAKKSVQPNQLEPDSHERQMFDEVYQGKNISFRNFTIIKKNCWRKLQDLPALCLVETKPEQPSLAIIPNMTREEKVLTALFG